MAAKLNLSSGDWQSGGENEKSHKIKILQGKNGVRLGVGMVRECGLIRETKNLRRLEREVASVIYNKHWNSCDTGWVSPVVTSQEFSE